MSTYISVEIAYALPHQQDILELEVSAGTTMLAAAKASDIAIKYPSISELGWDQVTMGIFGEVVTEPETRVLKAGDRVEIYRPLQMDPKESRRLREAKQKIKRLCTNKDPAGKTAGLI